MDPKPTCPLCGTELIKKGKRWYCPSCGRSWYICKYCGEAFENQRSLAAHMRTHRTQRVLDTASIVFEYARGLFDLAAADRVQYIRYVEELGGRGLEAGAAAAVALTLLLAGKGEAGVSPPRPRGERRVERPVPAAPPLKPAPQPVTAVEGEEGEGLPTFAKGNPWLKALGGRGAKG